MIRRCDELGGGEGCSFAAIHGKSGEEAAKWFQIILDMAIKHRDEVIKLQPANGWGNYDNMVEMFYYYTDKSKQHPKAIWTQSSDGSGLYRCAAGWICGEKKEDDSLAKE